MTDRAVESAKHDDDGRKHKCRGRDGRHMGTHGAEDPEVRTWEEKDSGQLNGHFSDWARGPGMTLPIFKFWKADSLAFGEKL